MNYQLAPLESVTTYIFRNAFHKHCYKMDKYYIPFLCPHTKKGFNTKEIREVTPENNIGYKPVPQIISNQADATILTIEKLKAYGYDEINLNFGCPSNTVVSRGRGAGFLAKTEELDRYLDALFTKTDVKISVKTRIGMCDAQEFYELIRIYNKYPLEELIIHPRLQIDYYNNHPDMETFGYAVNSSKNRICYNGDLCTTEDIDNIKDEYPSVDSVMIGRGILKNPTMLDGEVNVKVIKAFHDEVYNNYNEVYGGNISVIYKMKEIWMYMQKSFPNNEKLLKKIKKVQKATDYEKLMKEVFHE